MTQHDDIEAFMSEYLLEFERLEKASSLAYWTAANSGKKADFEAYAEADLALRKLHSDKGRYEKIGAFLEREGVPPLLRRSLRVARLDFEGNQLPAALLEEMVAASSEIEQIFNTFRATLDGREMSNNEMLEALKEETDTGKRKVLWEGLKQVGAAVAPKLKALAVLRNRAAATLGYDNYWQMEIALQEHDPERLLALFDELEAITREPFEKMKARLDGELAERFGVTPDAVMPWHYDNPFFQAAPPSKTLNPDDFYERRKKEDIMTLAAAFYRDIGLPADAVIARSDLYEREGKDQHAFCITIDRKKDVRTLLNIKPTADWMETALHEEGHAVYYVNIDEGLPFNLREANHIFTTEAIAMLFGALASNPTWLVEYADADPKQVERLTPDLFEQRRRSQLVFARWSLVMLHFEKALYEDPERDLNRLWWDTVERFQMVPRPENRDAPDWAAKPHFTIAPVYYHNYLMGEVYAAQLRHVLADLAGHAGHPWSLGFNNRKDFGRFLIEKVFAPGMSTPWPEFVEASTGEPLTARYFSEELNF